MSLALVPGLASAANNRDVYFGSPTIPDGGTGGNTQGTQIDYGTLAGETKVTEGGRTAVNVLIKNQDNQTLNHVKFAAGTNADAKPDNATNRTPDGKSLPQAADGTPLATIAAVFSDSSLTTCTTVPAPGVDCELGQLPAGASVKLTVIINVPATKGTYPYWVTGSWNEGWSATGRNADYNFATGSLKVLESNCGNGQSSYFLPMEQVSLTDGGSTDQCATQDASIASGLALGNKGGLAQVAIDSTTGTCPARFKCVGKPVSVSILGGSPVPGGVQWTVTWFGIKTLKGVLHLADDFDSTGKFTPIYLTKQYKCSATLTRDCWTEVTPSGPKEPASIKVVFITDSNGKGYGF